MFVSDLMIYQLDKFLYELSNILYLKQLQHRHLAVFLATTMFIVKVPSKMEVQLYHKDYQI